MKKLVRLPILLLFALAMFFACTKETQMSDGKTDPQGGVISATQDAGGNPAPEIQSRDGCGGKPG
ncbi:MAG: hypothetical protein KIS77_18400 [Saprospiraceae bacterium]|nr:hypothetical protein [Saprospiraceae bacterium]